MEYKVIEEFGKKDFEEMVNKAIQEGWRLQDGNDYCQAMVK